MLGGSRSARDRPSRAFSCLKQDEQDEQDGGRLGIRPKGLEDLNVYSISKNYDAKVREDLNVLCARFCCLKQDGQDGQDEQDDSPSPPKTIGTRVAITIKVLTDLLCLLRLRAIDIQVFQTFALSSWIS